jgi:hypothetical protein
MNAQNDNHEEFLKGKEYLDNGLRYELQNSQTTLALLANGQLGKKAPLIYDNLGIVLSFLTQLASCQWGCRGGDHVIENLVRRCCNYTFAALSLARSGYYDESLALVRGVAEVVNLMQAFSIDGRHLQQWKTMSDRQRRNQYCPAAVRRIIEESDEQPAIDNETFSALSELGVHVTPDSIKTSHQHDKTVYVGGAFSVMGFLLVINELGICLSPAIVLAGRLIDLPKDKLKDLIEVCNELRRSCSPFARAATYRDIINEVQRSHTCDMQQ